MFEFFYATDAQIPADHKTFYEQRPATESSPAGWYLKVNGAVARVKLEEFRDKNIDLERKITEANTKLQTFEGIDPVKARELMGREQELREDKLVKAGKVDEVVQERLKGVNEDHARQITAKDNLIKEKDGKIEQLSTQLKTVKIDNALLAEANSRGLQKGAETFLLAAARSQWDLDDKGNPVVKDANGKIRYGKDGDPMKPAEWMDELAVQHDFMFKPNQGSGAQPGGGGGGQGDGRQREATTGDVNPWKQEHWNVTRQMEIYKEDVNKAARLAKEAGRKLQVPTPPKK